jgi:hypothetical protein
LFQDYVLCGKSGAEALVTGDACADAVTRLQVYADAYRLRLLDALGNDYPALQQLAGAERFGAIGRAYIDAHPSTTASLRWFGRQLPQFLAGLTEADEQPALAELAWFEWSKGEVFDAPETEPLSLAAVAAVPPEHWPSMRLLLQPALRRLDLRSNVPKLAQAQEEAQQPLPPMQIGLQPLAWLLWRDAALDIRWRALDEAEAAALDAAAAGSTFGEICELLCRWLEPEQAPLQAAGLLKRWVNDGLVVELGGV